MDKTLKYIRSIIVKLWNVDVNIPLFLVLFIASWGGLIDVFSQADRLNDSIGYCFIWILTISKATLIIWTLKFAKRRISICQRSILWKIAYFFVLVMVLIYVFLCAINAICIELYGFGVTHKLLLIVMETTTRETTEFFPSFLASIGGLLSINSVLLIMAFLCAIISILFLLKKYRFLAPTLVIVTLLGVPATGYLLFTSNCDGSYKYSRTTIFMSARIYVYATHVYKVLSYLEELANKVMPLPYADQLQHIESNTNIVLVLGESALRDQWSQYGYTMNTTPNVSGMADSLFIFNDVVSASVTTRGSLEHIITFKSYSPHMSNWYDYPNIIGLFNAAGYNTCWYSNQEVSGDYTNLSYAMACCCDNMKFIGAIYRNGCSLIDMLTNEYDDLLLPLFNQIQIDDDKPDFAVIHLMGSHMFYSNRFPPSFARFTAADVKAAFPDAKYLDDFAAQVVADYNNSLAYTDSLLKIMVDRVAVCPQPTAFVYFSDHGSNVYRDRYYDGRDRICARVPMFIYVNAPFRAAHPDIVAAMERAVDLPISTADIIHPFMTIAGITYPLYDATRDFLSPQFYPSVRYVDETPWEEDIAAGLPDRYAH